jgi:mono/diheme cytochrome c family protein
VNAVVPSIVVVGLLWVAPAAGAEVPDLARGRALYENHCVVCHTQRVHTRPNRMALGAAELREIVDRWQREEKLRWGPQDIDDVVFYLRTTRYKF